MCHCDARAAQGRQIATAVENVDPPKEPTLSCQFGERFGHWLRDLVAPLSEAVDSPASRRYPKGSLRTGLCQLSRRARPQPGIITPGRTEDLAEALRRLPADLARYGVVGSFE